MALRRAVGNVLDGAEDAIIIAVDGGNPKQIGSVGRQLQARIDDDRGWDRIVAEAKFPIHSGSVAVVSLEDVPEVEFKFAIFAAMFHHRSPDVYIQLAYSNALAYAGNWGLDTVATPLYYGGWRGTPAVGTRALMQAIEERPRVDVVLYERANRTPTAGC